MIRTILLSLIVSLFSFGVMAEEVKHETKKVCVKQKDSKGVEKDVCKNVKQHAKLEGTKVPEKK